MQNISNQRSRGWCFTLNNFIAADLLEIDSWESLNNVTYMCVGREVGDEKKTPHLQGYVEFKNARRGSDLIKSLRGCAHWEVRLGSPKQASDYCKKDGVFAETGTLSRQGKRTDIDVIGDAIMSGESPKDVACDHPGTYIKFHKGIHALKHASYEDRTDPPAVSWLWGKSGVGKTRGPYDTHKPSVYIKDGTKWWDGYEQQDAIIIDDFDGAWPFRDLLRLLDRYPYQGQCKGSYVPISSPHIYITCEFPPSHFWQGDALVQVERRICEIIEVVPGQHRDFTVTEEKTESDVIIDNFKMLEMTSNTTSSRHHPLPEFDAEGEPWLEHEADTEVHLTESEDEGTYEE